MGPVATEEKETKMGMETRRRRKRWGSRKVKGSLSLSVLGMVLYI